jgi:hypothetical protein
VGSGPDRRRSLQQRQCETGCRGRLRQMPGHSRWSYIRSPRWCQRRGRSGGRPRACRNRAIFGMLRHAISPQLFRNLRIDERIGSGLSPAKLYSMSTTTTAGPLRGCGRCLRGDTLGVRPRQRGHPRRSSRDQVHPLHLMQFHLHQHRLGHVLARQTLRFVGVTPPDGRNECFVLLERLACSSGIGE